MAEKKEIGSLLFHDQSDFGPLRNTNKTITIQILLLLTLCSPVLFNVLTSKRDWNIIKYQFIPLKLVQFWPVPIKFVLSGYCMPLSITISKHFNNEWLLNTQYENIAKILKAQHDSSVPEKRKTSEILPTVNKRSWIQNQSSDEILDIQRANEKSRRQQKAKQENQKRNTFDKRRKSTETV